MTKQRIGVLAVCLLVAAAGMSIHCSEPGITSALPAAPPLFFSTAVCFAGGVCPIPAAASIKHKASTPIRCFFMASFPPYIKF